MGNHQSSSYESFGPSDAALAQPEGASSKSVPRSTHGAGGLLDYPQYTRPSEFRGVSVPGVLSSGNHDQIRKWRRKQALKKTWRNRPDLLQAAELDEEDRAFLRSLGSGF
jgi:tRNA (guanine37-N1)-methyltransferase